MQGSTVMQPPVGGSSAAMLQGGSSMMMGGGGGGGQMIVQQSQFMPPHQQQQLQQPPPPQQQQQQQHGRRLKPEDAAMHISVSDPVQHSDGLNKYTSYRVDVLPPAETFTAMMMGGVGGSIILGGQQQQPQQQYTAVLRRYSDFLWLYEKLHAERPGAIVPPLPEKQPVGRFSPQFVEDRRIHLERFLRRVAVHPELHDSPSLETFLRADDHTFQAAKNAKPSGVVMNASMMQSQYHHANNPYGTPSLSMMGMGGVGAASPSSSSASGGIKRWFAEAKTSMTGDLVRSPDDDLFDEINRYINGLDNQMKNISHQASGLVRKGKEIANGLFEFGLAFNLLGQSEADALGSALSSMGETADRLSVLSAEHAEREMLQFEEPLQDYIKMIHGVKLALQRRHEKRLSFSTCLSEVESKQSQLGKLRMQIGAEAKAYSMEMSLRRSQELAEVAREEFADCSQRVLREVDRFKREKAEDMRRTVLDYIQLQVEYNKRMEYVWSTLIPKLEQVQSSEMPQPPMNPPPLPPNMMMSSNNPHNPSSVPPGSAVATVSPENSTYFQQSQQQQPTIPPQQQALVPQNLPPMMQQQHQQQQHYVQQQPPAPHMAPIGDPSSMINVQYRETPQGM